ncbi:hypothetical protein [Streptomyces mangrovisoli]|uniref:Uncharacterized protein n=1 Tax=Streptomyces mangrovisoli TaxID=1428628 RepID=A0A1J4P5E3_9ACTN|nr:hypothetical protein [Streptomyces mangrovisoli]OIJ69792.1 hypothetical protein WN71_001005 [Streptomyces mangrovisoli]
MRKAIAAGALALVSAAGCLVLAPTASALPQACVTAALTTGSYEGVGSTRTKSATSSCSDLNLTDAVNYTSEIYDYYAGRLYYTSTSSWKTCNAGYIYVEDGTYDVDDVVLCSSVKDNTTFTVASYRNGGDFVRITH